MYFLYGVFHLDNDFYNGQYLVLQEPNGTTNVFANDFTAGTVEADNDPALDSGVGIVVNPFGTGQIVSNTFTLANAGLEIGDGTAVNSNRFKAVMPVVALLPTDNTQNGLIANGNQIYDPVAGNYELFDIITGGLQSDSLVGQTTRSNFISGGGLADILTGTTQKDVFAYGDPDGSGGDTINGFTAGADEIWLQKGHYVDALSSPLFSRGALPGANFVNVSDPTASVNASEHLIYVNSGASSGQLLFDPTGGDNSDRVLLATISGNQALTANDIVVF